MFYNKNMKTETIHAQKLDQIEASTIQDLHICPICGTEFRPTTTWVYKRFHNHLPVLFCRYNCMRTYDRMHQKKNLSRFGKRAWETSKESIEERIIHCKNRIKETNAELKHTDLSDEKRVRLAEVLRAWKRRLDEAEIALDAVEEV